MLTYQVTPLTNFVTPAKFVGVVSFGGQNQAITGQRTSKLPPVLQPALLSSGGLQLRISSEPGLVYEIQASTNLKDWGSLGAFTNTTGQVQFSDPESAAFRYRFYRVVLP